MKVNPHYLLFHMELSKHNKSIYYECSSLCQKFRKKIDEDPTLLTQVISDIKEADETMCRDSRLDMSLDCILNVFSVFAHKWMDLFDFDSQYSDGLEVVKAILYIIYIEKSEIDQKAFLSKTESHKSRVDFMKTQHLSCVDRHLLSLAEEYKTTRNKESRIYECEYLIYTYVMEYNYLAVKTYFMTRVFLKKMLDVDIDEIVVNVLFRLSSDEYKHKRIYCQSADVVPIINDEDKITIELLTNLVAEQQQRNYQDSNDKPFFLWWESYNEMSPNTHKSFFIKNIKHQNPKYRENSTLFTNLILQIAQMGYIENSVKEKYSLAYQLTGVAINPMHFNKIKWKGDSKVLFAIIKHITEDSIGFNKWDDIDLYFELPKNTNFKFVSKDAERTLKKMLDPEGKINLELLIKSK